MPITLERIPHDKQVAVYSLHSLGYSDNKISHTVDLSRPTVAYIRSQIPSNPQEVDTYKKGLIAWQYGVSQRAMCRITDDKLEKMNALQLMTINAIGIDKARDMEGSNRPVVNIVTMVGDLSSRLTDIKRKQQAIEAFEASTQA